MKFDHKKPLTNLEQIGLLNAFREVNRVQADAIKRGDHRVAGVVNHLLVAFYKIGPTLAEETLPSKLTTTSRARDFLIPQSERSPEQEEITVTLDEDEIQEILIFLGSGVRQKQKELTNSMLNRLAMRVRYPEPIRRLIRPFYERSARQCEAWRKNKI